MEDQETSWVEVVVTLEAVGTLDEVHHIYALIQKTFCQNNLCQMLEFSYKTASHSSGNET